MKRLLLLCTGGILLLVPGLVRLYLMMPFPGSQEIPDTIGYAYFLYNWYFVLRLLGIAAIIGALVYSRHSRATRIASAILLVLTLGLVWVESNWMNPERMFREMPVVEPRPGTAAGWPDSLRVIGVISGDSAVATPVYVAAYHHRIPLQLGGQKLWITYCSMCGTGTVFDLTADRYRSLRFRLIGMNRYNALFEDEETGTWWHQDTGEAIYGTRKGDALPMYTSETLPWKEWRTRH
ncbi:MAG: DUF3179 domain-containing protein, partial [Bacteroidetes bacterium]|nr:DUF3179 domain-containing protein [Bacteroidota bacterium]